MKTHVLLPAYNEEAGLQDLVPRLDATCRRVCDDYGIVVVNDGSRDRTAGVAAELAQRFPLHLLDFPQNRGVTEVFRAGFRLICSRAGKGDVCVSMDADGTQSPDCLPLILGALERADVVIASRFAPGGGMVGAPLVRRFWSAGASLTMRAVLPIPGVADYSTFYRGYRVAALRKGLETFGDDLVEGAGFASVAGILAKLRATGCSFAEVPFVLRYDLKYGESGMPLMKTLRGYVKLLATGRRVLAARRPP